MIIFGDNKARTGEFVAVEQRGPHGFVVTVDGKVVRTARTRLAATLAWQREIAVPVW